MKKHIEYNTKGTCSRKVIIDVEDGVIVDCSFVAGCPGNTMGVATLVKGMTVTEAIERLKGIRCGAKSTSCPDQLARALEESLVKN
ncbi:MAG: TIGR03905 family TSCPD domain-containing protein [Clostridia bacterium]|nr:TIGR03905 family TSCPD domain-containing protein [Clostridia bacterium]